MICVVALEVDAFCFLEGAAEMIKLSSNEYRFDFIDRPELKYLDYWEWFWEGACQKS